MPVDGRLATLVTPETLAKVRTSPTGMTSRELAALTSNWSNVCEQPPPAQWS